MKSAVDLTKPLFSYLCIFYSTYFVSVPFSGGRTRPVIFITATVFIIVLLAGVVGGLYLYKKRQCHKQDVSLK